MLRYPASVVLMLSLAAAPVAGQDENPGEQLKPLAGPVDAKLDDVATMKLPAGYAFVDKAQMPLLNKLTGNLDNPRDVGAILSDAGWVVFFSWDPIGYVKDDDKESLDANKLMEAFLEAQGPSNEQRRDMGLREMFIEGWQTPPFYDSKTNNLTWALKNRIGEGPEAPTNINHEIRLLGRRGAMSVILAAGVEDLPTAVPAVDTLLKDFSFNTGQSYAEYVTGDKVAAVGLAGLVLGGGALAAAKTGLLAKLGKFIKFIVIGVIAVVGGAFKWLSKRFKGEV